MSEQRSSRLSRWIFWAGVAGVVGAGIALRLIGLGSHPYGLYQDEAVNGLDALRVLDGYHPLYFPANNGREPLFVYLMATTVGLFGPTALGVRAAAAILGILTLAAAYLLGVAWGGKRVGGLSAAILAGYEAIVLTGPLSKLSRPSYTLFERRLRIVTGIALGLTGLFIYGSAAATARGDEVNLFFGVLWHHLFGLLILGGMGGLLVLRSRRWLRRTWGMGLLALWLAFNLFTVNWRFNLAELADPGPFTPNGVTQFLQNALGLQKQSQGQPGRIASGGLLPGGNSAASVYNLQDLTGNTPLQLAAVDAFFQQMPAWRLWQLMNVYYAALHTCKAKLPI